MSDTCFSGLGTLFSTLRGLYGVAAGRLGGVGMLALRLGHRLGVLGALFGQLRTMLGVAGALARVGRFGARLVGRLMIRACAFERLVAG